jgi:adenylate kinase
MSSNGKSNLNMVLFGPPGAGKGTLAAGLFGDGDDVPYLATGDHLRSLISAGDPRSTALRSFMEAGNLVPDEVIIGEVDAIFEAGTFDSGLLLDGFPRTEVQAEYLEETLRKRGLGDIQIVVYIDVADEVVIGRLTTRRICGACGAIYNTLSSPAKVDGVCDRCGGEVVQRADDTEETIGRRLAVYKAQTGAILAFYETRGLLLRVDGSEGSGHVLAVVRAHLRDRAKS